MEDPSHPRYTIHQPAAWDNLAATPELLKAASEADAICFGTLAQRSPITRETVFTVLKAASPKCLTVCDINLRQNFFDRDCIDRSLRQCRLAKINHEEVPVVAPLLGLPSTVADFARAARTKYGNQVVCVTRAAEGCFLVSDNEEIDLPGEKVKVADTVGAGDSFTAALIVSLCNQWPLERAARFANRVGSLMATKVGATPRVGPEYAKLWREFQPAA
jgi:fructokinase